ncbi:MAG: hypothetical protein WBG41_12665 [Acidimicrobiales bacterium]|jgi:hypothetical protein
MAEDEGRSGISVFDTVLVVGGGLIAVVVAFWILGFVASLLWTVFKVLIVVAIVVLLVRFVFGRH